MTTQERFILPIDDEGNVQFTPEFLKRTGWKPGDKVKWEVNEDGDFEVRKVDDD